MILHTSVPTSCRAQQRRPQGGFTLIELLVVFTIVGVLLTVAAHSLPPGENEPAEDATGMASEAESRRGETSAPAARSAPTDAASPERSPERRTPAARVPGATTGIVGERRGDEPTCQYRVAAPAECTGAALQYQLGFAEDEPGQRRLVARDAHGEVVLDATLDEVEEAIDPTGGVEPVPSQRESSSADEAVRLDPAEGPADGCITRQFHSSIDDRELVTISVRSCGGEPGSTEVQLSLAGDPDAPLSLEPVDETGCDEHALWSLPAIDR